MLPPGAIDAFRAGFSRPWTEMAVWVEPPRLVIKNVSKPVLPFWIPRGLGEAVREPPGLVWHVVQAPPSLRWAAATLNMAIASRQAVTAIFVSHKVVFMV